MAWNNFEMGLGTFTQWIANNTNCFTTNNYDSWNINQNGSNLVTMYGTTAGTYTVFNIDGFKFEYVVSSSNRTFRFTDTTSGLNYSISLGFNASRPNTFLGIGFGVNEDTQQGQIIIASVNTASYDQTDKMSSGLDKAYVTIKRLAPILYHWQSVPSIIGKNGILSLVTLDSEAINDGEPVSEAAISVFNQAPSTDNNVKDLADTYGSGEESSAVDVTVKYKVTLPPGGAFSVLKLVVKKDSIPEDATDGDKIVDISPTKTKKTVTGLDENSMYYFKIFAEDSNSNTSESDEKHILTSGDEGYNFDYTGEIVEWTVPKTGIYSLETWGAQGGNATDGTLTARGGYGAYAVGEVFLSQGDTLYINVGGQNGYGGGGNYTPSNE